MKEAQSRWEKSLKSAPALALPGEGLVTHLAGEFKLPHDAGKVGALGFLHHFSLAARVRPADGRGGTVVSRKVDEPQGEGYQVALVGGRVQVNLVKRWLDDALRVETVERVKPGARAHVLVTYDGSRVASGVKVYLDGRPARLRVLLDDLNQSFATRQPFRVGAGGGAKARFVGEIADVRIYNRALTAEQAAVAAVARPVEELARVPDEERTAGEAGKLRLHYLAKHASEEERGAHRLVDELGQQRQKMIDGFPTTMVMEEMAKPRDTFVLKRGQYDQPGEKVGPGVPAVLSPWPAGARRDRLGLADWLTDEANPLTARVAVNRFWQMLFGQGLVRTVDDFGAQGEPPTHPELLDWLAVEFRESGWDVKRLVRLVVTSATYRRSSRAAPELRRRDADNRLLARAPRLRLPAEVIRDQALAASGLLVEQVGGPSVKPYQPEGLWQELADTKYKRDSGAALYRRGLYTFWKRTVAPPALVTFDAAGREACSVRESRTNTPLQALNLLNDVTYVEAARALAARALEEGGRTDAGRLDRAFRLVLARGPRAEESAVLLAGLKRHRAHYEGDRAAARKLLRAGEAPVPKGVDEAELAAWSAVCGVLLNLDEAVTRE